MGIFELFSKRLEKAQGREPDVFQYEALDGVFRGQVVHILSDTLSLPKDYCDPCVRQAYKLISDILCREYGIFMLGTKLDDIHVGLFNWILTKDLSDVLNAIEVSFVVVNKLGSRYKFQADAKMNPQQAIEELNKRFLSHSIGYQFESDELIRIDSKLLHSEVTKPALRLLGESEFFGANEEFLKAHAHYRQGDTKSCLNECLKSLESTLKTICTQHGWSYKSTDTAKTLIDICFEKQLIPLFLQNHFAGLRATLEAGVPTIRNKMGGHGQGVEAVEIPLHFAAYALHLTATTIVFLAESSKHLS